MTYFTDPHALGGGTPVNVPSPVSPQTPAHIGIDAGTITPVVGGLIVTIPPVPTLRGPMPTPYPYIVIGNASGFLLQVSQGGLLAQIAPYTQDLVQVPDSNRGVTITTFSGTALISFGAEASVFATWYPSDPGGEYPAAIGAGQIPIGINSVITGPTFTGVNPSESIDLSLGVIPPWIQTIAIQFAGAIAPNGMDIIVVRGDDFSFIAEQMVSNAQIFYVPIEGNGVFINIVGDGINVTGTFKVYGIATAIPGPIIVPFGSGGSAPVTQGIQQPAAANIVAGANATLITAPQFGMQIRVKAWSLQYAVAPAAGGQILMRGTSAGLPTYLRHQVPGAINDPASPIIMDMWIPDFINANSHNQPDGVRIDNGSSQTLTTTIAYEIWPTCLAPV